MMAYWRKFLPNILTISRVVAIPAIILSFYINSAVSSYITFLIFCFACLTDFFDGYLARIWEVQSKFGRFLDPIADKLIVVSTIIMLVYTQKIKDLSIIPAIIVICREILVPGLREFLMNIKVSIPVDTLAKIKTFTQMFAMLMLILNNDYMIYFGNILLWIAAILTVCSAYNYFRIGIKYIY